MKNFNYYAPTQVVFGRNTETQVAELIKKYGGSKVLLRKRMYGFLHRGIKLIQYEYQEQLD